MSIENFVETFICRGDEFLLTFVSAQHAAVLLQHFDLRPDLHGRIVYSVKVPGLNRGRLHFITFA